MHKLGFTDNGGFMFYYRVLVVIIHIVSGAQAYSVTSREELVTRL